MMIGGFRRAVEADIKKSGLGLHSAAQDDSIEAVIFYIWAKGHLARSRPAVAGIALLSFIVGAFYAIVWFPRKLVEWLPALVFAGIIVSLIKGALEPALFQVGTLSLYLVVLTILWRTTFYQMLRNVMLEFGDAIFLGAFSRSYARRHLIYGRLRELDDKNGMKAFLFTSRVLGSGPHQRELDAFQDVLRLTTSEQDEITKEIEEFWRIGREDLEYWQRRLAQLRRQQG